MKKSDYCDLWQPVYWCKDCAKEYRGDTQSRTDYILCHSGHTSLKYLGRHCPSHGWMRDDNITAEDEMTLF